MSESEVNLTADDLSVNVTTLLENQMTHFPALAPDPNDFQNLSTAAIASTSKDGKGGNNNFSAITSLFGNLFRSTSKISSTSNSSNTLKINETGQTDEQESNSVNAPSLSFDCHTSINESLSLPSPSHIINSSYNQNNFPVTKKVSNGMFKNNSNDSDECLNVVDRPNLTLNNIKLINYYNSEFRRYWMPDSTGKECYECYEKFNAFRRRHHCRLCGQIFCGKCSNRQVNGADLGYSGVLRLCNFCANQVEARFCERRIIENTLSVNRRPYHNLNSSPEGNSHSEAFKFVNSQANKKVLSVENADFEVIKESSQPQFKHCQWTSSDPLQFQENSFLENLFEKNIEQILDCLLERESLDPKLWRNLLLRLSRQIISLTIEKILKVADALNILDFVHIKKFAVSTQPYYDIIEGVVFSKTLAHSSMLTKAQNFSLMLLSGNISYERVTEKLSSLEPIMLQEVEYLKIQVDRVISRHVSLLLVENSVAKLASDMLLAEGVGLVTNVKHKVLQRVSRATNSDVITSLDAQFLQPRIGFVPDFEQREYTMLDGKKKKVLVLDNCLGKKFGVSINLYGPTLKDLIAAKRILKFLLISRYSSKLEIAFLAMFNSVPGKSINVKTNALNKLLKKDENCVEKIGEVSKKNKCESEINENLLSANSTDLLKNQSIGNDKNICNEVLIDESLKKKYDCQLCNFNYICEVQTDPNPTEFLKLLRKTQLTNSPVIRFAPPYLETKAGRSCFILSYLKSPLFRFLTADDLFEIRKSDEELNSKLLKVVDDCKSSQLDNEKLRHAILEECGLGAEVLLNPGRWARFRVHSSFLFRRRYELNRLFEQKRTYELNEILRQRQVNDAKSSKSYISIHSDVLSPYNCQRIAFLYCANARKGTQNAKTFCMGPYVLLRQFFFGQESGHKDTSLGVFLANYCFNADYKCSSCDRSMMDHLRRIVHRNARIEITTLPLQRNGSVFSGQLHDELSVEELPSSIPNMNCSAIICWRRCKKCSANSCIVPLSEAVYHLSFAKFVDYLANGDYWMSEFPADKLNGTCPHCTFHEHVHFFAHYNNITSFAVFPIRPLHVIFNPMVCRLKPTKVLCSDLIEMNYDLNSTASEVFDRALSFFKDFQNDWNEAQCNLQLSPAAEALLSFVEQFKAMFRTHMGKFDPDGLFKQSKAIESNDSYYIQSESCLVRCRYFLHSFITKWNSTKLDFLFTAVPPSTITQHSNMPISVINGSTASLLSANMRLLPNGNLGKNASIRHDNTSTNFFLHSGAESCSSTASSMNSSLSLLSNLNSTDLSKTEQISDSSLKMTLNASTTVGSLVNNRPSEISQTESNLSNLNKTHILETAVARNISPELPTLINPLPKNLHFELPMNNLTVLVRDMVEGKTVNADIGSVIAYTLASTEYEERKNVKAKAENESNICELSFGLETKSKYTVKVYFPNEFETFRSLHFGDGEEQYIRSISCTTPWFPQGGKSGAFFYCTEDERFVIKQMSRFELESFKKCGLSYFDYVGTALMDKKLTALCKIYGVYGLTISGKNQQSLKIDVLVMEYLFYGKNVKQVYDLKGSLRNRYASTKTEASVLLDENLVQDLWGNQLYVHPYSKAALNQAITNDCHFLSNQSIMDYSLLAGICNDSDDVVIGIVDYMRTFTLDKKVESLVKTALPIAHSPTVVSPELYCKRFYDAIDGYFAVAPDQWTHSDVAILKQ